jgi:hypothetical protein
MLQLVRHWSTPHADKYRHSEIILVPLADDLANRTPIGEVIQVRFEPNDQRGLAVPLEMKAVFRSAAGQRCGEGRGPASKLLRAPKTELA